MNRKKMNKDTSSVVILGAGLAGLTAAEYLAARGKRVLVIEKDAQPGGLAVTLKDESFHYDCGPHRFHTKNPELLQFVEELLPDELLELERLSRIRLLDRYFQYPLALGDVLKRMPIHKGIGMIFSYLGEKVRRIIAPRDDANFEGWVVSRFGRKLYDLYFGPYTEKLWGCPANELSADWASQRITVPGLAGLIKATLFPNKEQVRSLISTFFYPKGGIGRICQVLAERVTANNGEILYNMKPESIRWSESGGFIIDTGSRTIEADKIVNTIPVGDYVNLLGDILPRNVQESVAKLHFRAIVFVVLRISRRVDARDHWIYAPEKRYIFNRLSIPENFDPECSDTGSQVVFEFSCAEGDDIWNEKTDLLESAITGGERLELFTRDEVLGSTVVKQAHAYPIYGLNYASESSVVLDALDGLENSVTCGRQGLFRYNNMDHSIEMGKYAAMEILEEGTIREKFAWTSDTWADG